MKKIYALLLSFLLLIPWHLPEGNSSYDGNVLYVGGNGEGNYSSISDAVFAAEDGDTIFVYSGTYEESVYIGKRINLIGESKESVIIVAGIYGYAINVSCDGVFIKNFSITGGAALNAGVVIHSCSCILENCRVYENSWDGISIKGDGNVIRGCEIFDNLYGIEISGDENSIENCSIYGNSGAIEMEYADGNIIEKCEIGNNIYSGISMTKSSHNTIHDCVFHENGIMITGESINEFIQDISNNSIDGKPILYFKNEAFMENGTKAGEIIAVGCNDFVIQNAEIEFGIEIAYCNNGMIKNCRIYGGYYGLLAYHSNGNIVEGNYVHGANESGIELQNCDENLISSNEIEYAANNAIAITESCNNGIYNNKIHDNGMGVLIFSYSNGNNISGNDVHDNQFYGISIQGGSYNIIEKNYIYANKEWCGIAIAKSWTKYNIIRENNISENKCGIHLEGIGNTVERNNIYKNGYGIFLSAWLSKCKRNRIAQNNFIGNGRDASFEVDLLSLNKWQGNYWDSWMAKTPKPIYGYAIIEFGRYGFGIRFPWVNFDWHPALQPYEI